MPSSSDHINYAHASGINSVAGAVVFAVLYAILLPYYISRAIQNPTYVFILLSFFCASEPSNASSNRGDQELTVHF